MILTIHRGSKKIGGSCVELRSPRGDRILLDVGMPLTQPDGSDWPRGTMTRPGEELRREGVLPDIDGLYAGSTPEVSALVLSHAHLDHYGLAHYVHPDIPVYGSRGTIEMLRASKLFVPDAAVPADLRELPTAGTVSDTVPAVGNSRRSAGTAASGTNSFDARSISIVPRLP